MQIAIPKRLEPAFLLGALVLFTACLQGARAPNVPPRGTLAIGEADEKNGAAHGQFGVVFATPRGQTTDPSEVTLVFNRPMRPLDLAGDEAKPPVIMKPEVRGRWNWLGTTSLVFVPETELPHATEFTVEVPAGTRALDGSSLAKTFTLKFATARPALARIEPWEGFADLEPGSKFTLRFNQPIADAELLRAVQLSAGEDKNIKSVAFEVKRPDPKNEMLAEIAPKTPLPLDSPIKLHVDKSLRGKEGPLPADIDKDSEYHTYGPLVVQRLSCSDATPNGQCAVDGGFSIEFSNRVRVGDVKRALRVPGVKFRFSTWRSDDDLTRSVDVFGRFQPGHTYHASLSRAGIVDDHKQALGKDFAKDVVFDDLWPEVEIGVRGSVFEPTVKRDVPVASINVGNFQLATAALSMEGVLAIEGDVKRQGRFNKLSEVSSLPGASTQAIKPGAGKNTVATHTVSTDDILGGKGKRGAIAIGVEYTEKPGTRYAHQATRAVLAQVTDLGITAKISPYGSLVWVTHLSDGQPVEGAEVTIRRPGRIPLQTFKTDKTGIAAIPATEFTPSKTYEEDGVIFARSADDWAYRAVRTALASYRYGVSHDFSDDKPIGMLFTERGIYRPGDTVKLKGIFRREARTGTTTPAGTPVEVQVSAPDGEEISKQTPTLGPFGTFSIDVKVPETGRLGTYEVRAKLSGSPRDSSDAAESFEVAEYRASEFKVSVESDKPSYIRGDKASWSTHGDYLFGAPMTNADARISVTRSPTYFTPPNLEGYVVEDETYWFDRTDMSPRGYEVQSGNSRLDGKGTAALAAALTMPGQRGAELVTCEAEVTDVSRQAAASSSSAIVHPGDFYVAMKPPADLFVKQNDQVKPEILAVDPKGNHVAGVAVKVELVQRTWQIAKQNVGGGVRTESVAVDKVIASCDVKTEQAPAACSLATGAAGYYVLHATAKDKRGNPLAASTSLYVTGDGETSWSDSDTLGVKLVADRKSYEVGQTAKILVKSPFKSADALVTVERAGVYTQRRMTLTGSMPTIDVPITEDLRPNAFLSVVLVRGRSKAAPQKIGAADVGAPAFRMGYAELPINPEARRLKATIKTNKSDYKPGDNIEVDVDVKDRKGAPAKGEVTLYAVDEGVLMLIGYKTPDPIPVFGAPRTLKVATVETREDLAGVLNPFADLGLDKGANGGGGGEGGVRKDFRASAYYNPQLFTDANGHVHASFKLPDSLTTYRVMAVVAAEDDRFGYAEEKVTTSRPLMARPAFPRQLRAGDSLEAGVIVTSKGIDKQRVEVEVAVDGLVLKDSAKKAVDLDSGSSVEVRFAMDAVKAGTARVRFKAHAGAFDDSVEITRKVVTPTVMEAVALYGDTTEASAEKLGDLSAMRDDVGGLDVSLSSTALVGLKGGVEQLVEYPYGCTEQLTSRLVPLLPLRDLANDFKLDLPKDIDKVVSKTVADVLSHQRGDGGFGMWEGSSESDAWVTAYALWGLATAQKYNVHVPKAPIESGTAYLRSRLAEMDANPWLRATAPFIVDVLAQLDAPDPGRVDRLFEERQKLPLFSQALLLHAMVLSKTDSSATEKLMSEIEGHIRIDGNNAYAVANYGDQYAVLMDSEARTSALVLRGLLAAKPGHSLGSKLAMGLLGVRRGGAWRSTQETAWALLSLDDYRKAQEKVTPNFTARVFLGEKELFESSFAGRGVDQPKTNIPAANLTSAGGAPLSFAVDGTGRLFYEARLKYARKVMPRTPLERGFYVKKTIRPVKPEALEEALKAVGQTSVSAYRGGDLVLGEIVVVTPSPRDFVVVDDPLPAGFEAIDARLATSARGMDVDANEDRAEEDSEEPDNDEGDVAADKIAMHHAYRPSDYLREVRDDRVLFFVDHMGAGMYRYRYLARATSIGTFQLPPTKAEEMYQPEVFGRSGADVIRISPK